MKHTTFSSFTLKCITKFEQNGRYSTAHLYKNSLHSYTKFLGKHFVLFSDISRDNLKFYEQWLMDQGKRPNTISTYLRMLRSIYNKGIDHGYAKYIRRLFYDVYTGIDTNHKKALSRKDLHSLLYQDPKSEKLRKTQYTARLIYQLC